jgi:hypothetical protein
VTLHDAAYAVNEIHERMKFGVRPKKVYTHHGYAEFADVLKHRRIDACLACPEPQLSLFPA